MSKFVEVELLQSTQVGNVAVTQTIKIPLPTVTMLAVGIDITAESGTAPTLSAWLVGSDDGGVTWYDIPYTLRMKSNASGTDITADTNQRNIADVEADTTARIVAIYSHLPFRDIALAYIVGGSATPTKTFSASAVGK